MTNKTEVQKKAELIEAHAWYRELHADIAKELDKMLSANLSSSDIARDFLIPRVEEEIPPLETDEYSRLLGKWTRRVSRLRADVRVTSVSLPKKSHQKLIDRVWSESKTKFNAVIEAIKLANFLKQRLESAFQQEKDLNMLLAHVDNDVRTYINLLFRIIDLYQDVGLVDKMEKTVRVLFENKTSENIFKHLIEQADTSGSFQAADLLAGLANVDRGVFTDRSKGSSSRSDSSSSGNSDSS